MKPPTKAELAARTLELESSLRGLLRSLPTSVIAMCYKTVARAHEVLGETAPKLIGEDANESETTSDPLAHFRGTAGTVSVRSVDPEGPWRLFLGIYGVADWPSKAAAEDPQGYAMEVARCVLKALEDEVNGPQLKRLKNE